MTQIAALKKNTANTKVNPNTAKLTPLLPTLKVTLYIILLKLLSNYVAMTTGWLVLQN